MWEYEHLIKQQSTLTFINEKWVPARPVKYKPKYCSLWKRVRYAWRVVIGKSETFKWPEGQ